MWWFIWLRGKKVPEKSPLEEKSPEKWSSEKKVPRKTVHGEMVPRKRSVLNEFPNKSTTESWTAFLICVDWSHPTIPHYPKLWKKRIRKPFLQGPLFGTSFQRTVFPGTLIKKKNLLNKQNWWSRVNNCICCRLNTIRNLMNYFTTWEQRYNNKIYSFNWI